MHEIKGPIPFCFQKKLFTWEKKIQLRSRRCVSLGWSLGSPKLQIKPNKNSISLKLRNFPSKWILFFNQAPNQRRFTSSWLFVLNKLIYLDHSVSWNPKKAGKLHYYWQVLLLEFLFLRDLWLDFFQSASHNFWRTQWFFKVTSLFFRGGGGLLFVRKLHKTSFLWISSTFRLKSF